MLALECFYHITMAAKYHKIEFHYLNIKYNIRHLIYMEEVYGNQNKMAFDES